MDKIEQIKIMNISKDTNNNLKITYNIKLSHCKVEWWIENLIAYYDNNLKIIREIERPTRTKQNKIIDLLLNKMIKGGIIND